MLKVDILVRVVQKRTGVPSGAPDNEQEDRYTLRILSEPTLFYP